ncbi:site-2 protease family protein, partial [candidate division KSB1 bacterium]|nr:site-2 protease family protein [candidate division KSB1 bacterium]
VFSTVCHEAAHAFIGLKLGDSTAYEGGQTSLDPRPHVRREPIGMVAIPFLSYAMGGWMFGWASAPYDPFLAIRYPKRSVLMSLAGPAANLSIALCAGLLIRAGILADIFYAPESIAFSSVTEAQSGIFASIATLLSILFSLNLILGCFNLLPLPPLDGSGTVPLFLQDDTARGYMDFVRNPSFLFIGIFIAWKIFYVIFRPIHLLAINFLYWGIGSYH